VDRGLHIPISIKLAFATVTLIVAVVAPIAFHSSQLFRSTFSKSQNDANAELTHSKATEVETLLFNYLEKVRTITNLVLTMAPPDAPNSTKNSLDLVFIQDLDIVNIDIYQLKNGRPELYRRETNLRHLQSYDLNSDYLDRLRKERPFPVMAVFQDDEKIVIRNSTLAGGMPLFTMGIPFADAQGVTRHVAIADFRLDRLQKAFALSDVRTLYLVDTQGTVIAHSDDKLALGAVAVKSVPIVAEALKKGGIYKGQKRFLDPLRKKWFIGAYSKTAFDVAVIAQTPEEIILEPAKAVLNDAVVFAGYGLSVALFIVMLFSLSLSYPIEKLHEATLMVARGNLNIQAKIRTNDEVGELARAFNFMVDGLKERDKVKNILNKFHGSSITEDLLKNDLRLGGSRKNVTVFFSDIRDFTKFSESHTPEQVVEMLNEYFQIMVSLITTNRGIVDKFVGDAIMAIWGAPQSTERDCWYAVRACLEMRMALAQLNDRRVARGQPPIKIGMGLHTGPAISGKIGSTERMEYTVIGDTVNMASRIEASTKAFGADLLISEAVAKEIRSGFILEEAGVAEVKGKSEGIRLYKVRGYIEATGEKVVLQTPYSDYEPAHADKVKIAG
jgi:adenylate cyclase